MRLREGTITITELESIYGFDVHSPTQEFITSIILNYTSYATHYTSYAAHCVALYQLY